MEKCYHYMTPTRLKHQHMITGQTGHWLANNKKRLNKITVKLQNYCFLTAIPCSGSCRLRGWWTRRAEKAFQSPTYCHCCRLHPPNRHCCHQPSAVAEPFAIDDVAYRSFCIDARQCRADVDSRTPVVLQLCRSWSLSMLFGSSLGLLVVDTDRVRPPERAEV